MGFESSIFTAHDNIFISCPFILLIDIMSNASSLFSLIKEDVRGYGWKCSGKCKLP